MMPPDHKRSLLRDRIAAVLYLAATMIIAFYAGRQCLSEYLAASAASTNSLARARLAVEVFEDDPYPQRDLGLLELGSGDADKAASAFEKAARIRKRDHQLWVLLGIALSEANDLKRAETAFATALSLAPHYSRPNFLLGTLRLRQGRTKEGFELLARSAENNLSLLPKVVDLAEAYFPDDPVGVERVADPRKPEARKYLASRFITRSWMTPDMTAFLLGPDLTERERDIFINDLVNRSNFSLAHDLWLSSLSPDERIANSVIFDGGFENTRGTERGRFGWKVNQNISGIEVTRTQRDVHSGAYAIHLKFAGNSDLGRDILTQLVYLRPDASYILRLYYRSAEMLSNSSPIFVISDPATRIEIGRTAPLQASAGKWVETSITFTSTRTSAVELRLIRPSCSTNPCPIFGDLSLDELSITPR